MANPELTDRVSSQRWQEAQRWEEQHWVGAQAARAKWGKNYIWRALHALGLVPKNRGEDWNRWWMGQFDDYRFLPEELGNVIEVGCGPYTNVRWVQERCRAGHLFLSDPLIRTYVGFQLAYVADCHRHGFAVLDDHAIEELPFRDDYFDLTIMINVLDHVRDARRCMDVVTSITRPGGWLILGQDLTDEADLAVLKNDPGLVGHPIKLQAEWFKPWLDAGFEPVLHRILPRELGREPSNHYATLLFAGRKLPGTAQ